MIISIGFILLILFDFSKLFFENKTVNSLFPAGLFCIGFGVYREAVRNRGLTGAVLTLWREPFWLAVLIISVVFLIKTTFISVSFEDTYIKTGKKPLCDRGLYGICRHPGFWFMLTASFAFAMAFSTWHVTNAMIKINVLNFLYIVMQDMYFFPKYIEGYEEYKKRVGFLIPKTRKIRR